MPVRSFVLRLYAVTLLLVCMAAGCSARIDDKTIELSYREHPGFCAGCDAFQLTFRTGGNAEFRGFGGCALPGSHSYRIPESDWRSLVQLFRSSDFVSIPRLGPHVFDSDAFLLTYRDARNSHEVIDTARGDKRLLKLEQTMRKAGRIEPWLTPTPELYREALARHWNVNTLNEEDDQNALTCAVRKTRIGAARVLLAAGSNVTPDAFRMSLRSGDSDLLQLLDAKAPIDPRSELAADLLHSAVRLNPASVRYLLSRGVAIDSRNAVGATALMTINHVDSGLQMFDFLLAHSANVNATDRVGKSAMHYAAEGADSGFIAKLARAGARVDIMDRQGFTPLMYAARSCKYWNVPALIEAGANPRRALDALPNEAQYLAHGTERNCRQTYQALTSR
jgi:hypothetical protein